MNTTTENNLDEDDAGPQPRVTDAPMEIWLQYGDELLVDTPHSALARDGEVSWCDSQVFPFDVKYVRADEIDRLRARVADTDGAITVLGFQNAELRARVAELEAERADDDALRERMADILKRTAVALRGPEPPLTAWSWHDLPERAAAAIASIYLFERVARDLSDPRGLVPMLVDRFLGWKLPDDFAPDCGITFKRESDYEHPVYGRTKYEPVGTNLLTAVQATAMFEHLLGIDAAAAKGEPDTEEKTKACPRCHMGEYMDRDGDWHECLTCDRTGLVPDTDASAKDGA